MRVNPALIVFGHCVGHPTTTNPGIAAHAMKIDGTGSLRASSLRRARQRDGAAGGDFASNIVGDARRESGAVAGSTQLA